ATIVLSKSGSTDEVLRLMPILKQQKSPIIAIVGNLDSPIAQSADVVLDASVSAEADSLNLMPTASSSVSLAIGDALATALAQARGFSAEQFAVHHPGGQLGRNLTVRIESVMHPLDHIACASLSHSLRDVLILMTEHPLGAACIVDKEEQLLGIITDGDVRRLLANKGDILDLPIGDCMTQDPLTVNKEQLLGEAIQLMEDRESQISVLPVVISDEQKLVGLVRLHDAYQPSSLQS
ncbi:MAG: CBS domain-containing protein, partial [Puniceicoccaceae bacterium]|nr:CBS domain-containing protein [Puniceicoccaceae bacterium]